MNVQQIQDLAVKRVREAEAGKEHLLETLHPALDPDSYEAAKNCDPDKSLVALPLVGLRLFLKSMPDAGLSDQIYRDVAAAVGSGVIPDVNCVHVQANHVLHICRVYRDSGEDEGAGATSD